MPTSRVVENRIAFPERGAFVVLASVEGIARFAPEPAVAIPCVATRFVTPEVVPPAVVTDRADARLAVSGHDFTPRPVPAK